MPITNLNNRQQAHRISDHIAAVFGADLDGPQMQALVLDVFENDQWEAAATAVGLPRPTQAVQACVAMFLARWQPATGDVWAGIEGIGGAA